MCNAMLQRIKIVKLNNPQMGAETINISMDRTF